MAAIIDPDVIENWAELLMNQGFDDKEDAEKFLYTFLIELGIITREDEKKAKCCDD